MNFSHVQLLFLVNCYRWNLALQGMSLQRAKLLFCDNLFECCGAFERTKLQYFDICLGQPHA